jgi:hypothetical protein
MVSEEKRVQHTADPSWPLKIDSREAVLWIGPSLVLQSGQADAPKALADVIRHRWAAVYVDVPGLPITTALPDLKEFGGLVPRLFDEEAPPNLGANRLPIYGLRGPDGLVGPRCVAKPDAYFKRIGMLKLLDRDMSPGYELFALGIATPDDLEGLVEAVQVSSSLKRLIVVSPESLELKPLTGRGMDRLIHWVAGWSEVISLLEESGRIGGSTGQVLVRMRISGDKAASKKPVDITRCVHPSHPITGRFDLITEPTFRTDRPPPNEEQVQAFLADPSASWEPYADGIPYPRHAAYLQALVKYLRIFAMKGHSSSLTAWFQAEDGSGVTTALRQICFDIAREGYPVLVARRDVNDFDFRQISAFLKEVSDLMVEQGIRIAEVPWVIAFDAEHVELNWDFIGGLCNGLKNLMRSVIVLAVRPRDELRLEAKGTERTLTENSLANTVTVEEGVSLGNHLARFLPKLAVRTRAQWEAYVEDTVRSSTEGPKSLFWVALRFWLTRVAGAEESLRHWLTAKFENLVSGQPEAYAGFLEVATLAKHRLVTPSTLLLPQCFEAIRRIANDSANPIGLRLLRFGRVPCVTYAHPQIAEEILRISMGQPLALAAVEVNTCYALLDLELHLLGRLVARPSAGNEECVPIIETLITSVLRVDLREAPRNWPVRDRIVALLEKAPDTLWDRSPVFNHHMAKARRNLAVYPPTPDWTIEARREQLELAADHLKDALHYLVPSDSDRAESPLNLRVSLALTCDARARLEDEDNQPQAAELYRKESEENYATAIGLDADNSYVLENYARYKLHVARTLQQTAERTRLVIEAIAMLELERASHISGLRDEPILQELGKAYNMLKEGNGKQFLLGQAANGLEAALTALAKLEVQTGDGQAPTEEAYKQAEAYLRQVAPARVTWRSRLPLYQVISQSRRFDLPGRLEVLEDLRSDPTFHWPLQILLEFGILLFQTGDPQRRHIGVKVFKDIRTELFERERTANILVPDEIKFLRDPRTDYRKPLLTSIIVKPHSSTGKSNYGIPIGWDTVDVQFFPHRFPHDRILPRGELDCLIQFTNFGPQAVPRSEGDDR